MSRAHYGAKMKVLILVLKAQCVYIFAVRWPRMTSGRHCPACSENAHRNQDALELFDIYGGGGFLANECVSGSCGFTTSRVFRTAVGDTGFGVLSGVQRVGLRQILSPFKSSGTDPKELLQNHSHFVPMPHLCICFPEIVQQTQTFWFENSSLPPRVDDDPRH